MHIPKEIRTKKFGIKINLNRGTNAKLTPRATENIFVRYSDSAYVLVDRDLSNPEVSRDVQWFEKRLYKLEKNWVEQIQVVVMYNGSKNVGTNWRKIG